MQNEIHNLMLCITFILLFIFILFGFKAAFLDGEKSAYISSREYILEIVTKMNESCAQEKMDIHKAYQKLGG